LNILEPVLKGKKEKNKAKNRRVTSDISDKAKCCTSGDRKAKNIISEQLLMQ